MKKLSKESKQVLDRMVTGGPFASLYFHTKLVLKIGD